MFLLSKPKRVANIMIDDYVVRIAENKDHDLATIRLLEERELPRDLIQHGKIIDELGFYQFMKELVHYWKLKHREVRFYVPNPLVIMRHVDIPIELETEAINTYFMEEVGRSIHFPFSPPLLDVFVPNMNQEQTEQETKKGILFAAPEEEILKYIGVFEDVGWTPTAIDIQPLGVFRYFHHQYKAQREKVYLLFECNLLSTNISIFYRHSPEFIRFQQLDLQRADWQADTKYSNDLNWSFVPAVERWNRVMEDELTELQRIIDFYRYSLYKGEKTVDAIILYGDMPHLSSIAEKIKAYVSIPVTILQGNVENENIAFVPVLGLALKGDTTNAPRD